MDFSLDFFSFFKCFIFMFYLQLAEAQVILSFSYAEDFPINPNLNH